MKPRLLVSTVGLLVSGVILFGIGQSNHIPILSVVGGFLGGSSLSYLGLRQVVIVPGRTAYRLENSLTKRFARLLYPGIHLLKPGEVITGSIELAFFGFPGELNEAQSADNIPHHITYDIAAECNPDEINPALLADFSKLLADNTSRDNLIRSQANECLRAIMGDLQAQRMTNGYRISDLNDKFKQALSVKVGIFGIKLHRTALGSIRPPPDYQAGLIASELRRIETDIMLNAISRLATVLGSMPENDKALIGELEKYRILNNGDAASLIIQNGGERDSGAPIVVRDRQKKKPSG